MTVTFDLDAFQAARDEETYRIGGADYTRARLGHALRISLADIEAKIQALARRAVRVARDYEKALEVGDDESAARLETEARDAAREREKLDLEYVRRQLRDQDGKNPPAKALVDYDAAALQALQDALEKGAREDERDPTETTATPGDTSPS